MSAVQPSLSVALRSTCFSISCAARGGREVDVRVGSWGDLTQQTGRGDDARRGGVGAREGDSGRSRSTETDDIRRWAGTHVVEDGSVVVHGGGHRGGAPVGILEVQERGTATECLEDLGVAVGGGDHGGGLAGHLKSEKIERIGQRRIERVGSRVGGIRGGSPNRPGPIG